MARLKEKERGFALVLAIIFFNERERMWLKITGFCIAALGAIVLRIAA